MFAFYFLHGVYAILMFIFSFRLMLVPHAVLVAMMAIYYMATKGYIIAPILMLLYAFIAVMVSIGMDDDTGNGCILWWIVAASNLAYVCYAWLM